MAQQQTSNEQAEAQGMRIPHPAAPVDRFEVVRGTADIHGLTDELMPFLRADVFGILKALEQSLHQPEVRSDRIRLAALLDPEFREFGRSGQTCAQADILDLLSAEEATTPRIHAQDFALTELAPGAALLTYRSAHCTPDGGLTRHTNRSSIWRLGASGWQMVFHQGTPTQPFEPVHQVA